MSKVSITHVSNAHNDWIRSLDFYKGEIKILRKRLTEVAGKNSERDVLKDVDHYENQFEIQLSNINRLKHAIETNIGNIGTEVKNSKVAYVDGEFLEIHNELEQKYVSEERTVNDLRHTFNQFAAQWI